MAVNGSDRDLSRKLRRIAVDAARDRREGERARAELRGHLERAPVARRQQLGLALSAPAPDRPDRVDDPPCRQPSAGRRLRVADAAAAQEPALLENRVTAGAVDRPVDAAAAEQARVRRVDDRVDGLLP